MATEEREVVGGVDTHADTHTLAVLDLAGRRLGVAQFGSAREGCAQLLAALQGYGRPVAVGVEGTGSYGAGLARLLTAAGLRVVEVDRPDRRARRSAGKSDPVDALAAARAVLAEVATGTPKSRVGVVESIRLLKVTRESAVRARTAALNSLLGMARSAVEPLAGDLAGQTSRQLVTRLLELPETAPSPAELIDPRVAALRALRRLAQRVGQLDEEIHAADRDLDQLTAHAAPRLRARPGVGPQVAAQLLITAGDNPTRLASERAFARLAGVAPLPASSGRTVSHRLNRGGDRQANRALHTVVLTRMRHHQPTQGYLARRTTEGKSRKAIMRCLKRYLARELFTIIVDALTEPPHQPPTPVPNAA